MSDIYLFYYIESMIVCSMVFLIFLMRDLIHGERNERIVHFDHVLISQILYFTVDCFQASLFAGVIPKTTVVVFILNYVLLVLLALIASTWFAFALAVMELPWRGEKKGKMMIYLPIILSSVITLVWMIADRSAWIDEELTTTALYSVFFLAAPVFYLVAGFIYSMREAYKKKNVLKRNLYFILGIYPIIVLASGVVQFLLLRVPFFCYNSMIMIILFSLLTLEDQISIDPLTKLNNRGQLMRYAMQESSIHREDSRTFVVMLDANDFKRINDTYGHVEGDRALVLIADVLKRKAADMDIPPFIARFGGDEFVMLIHTEPEAETENLAKSLTESLNHMLAKECIDNHLPYTISITLGVDEVDKNESFQDSLTRADDKLYQTKKNAGVGR